MIVATLCASQASQARTLRTAHFVITVDNRSDASRISEGLELAYVAVRAFGLRLPSSIPVTIHRSTFEFAARSGANRMHIAGVRSGRIHLQPIGVLERFEGLDRSLTHELVHVALAGAGGRMPRWLSEGLAMNVAGERHPAEGGFGSAVELDRALAGTQDVAGMKRAYGTAERMTRTLIERVGRAKLLAAVRSVLKGRQSAAAFRSVAGLDIDAWVAAYLRSR